MLKAQGLFISIELDVEAMLREKKPQAVDELQESLSRSAIAVVTDYRGLTAAEMTELRRRLRESDLEYKVVKNTLARFAAERAGKEGIQKLLEGPTAIVFGYSNVAKPAQILMEYIRTQGGLPLIKGGLMGERVLSSVEVSVLATLPSREVLISQLVGRMQAPISRLLNVFNAPLGGLVGILQARIQQMKGEGDARESG